MLGMVQAISGWRSGALGSVLSFAGVLLGAVAGVLLAPHIVGQIAAPRAKLFAALFPVRERSRSLQTNQGGPRGGRPSGGPPRR